MSEHVHKWRLPDGPFLSIDTYPPQYPYECVCGLVTHDRERGTPCRMCSDPAALDALAHPAPLSGPAEEVGK